MSRLLRRSWSGRVGAACRAAGPRLAGTAAVGPSLLWMFYGLWTGAWYGYAFAIIFFSIPLLLCAWAVFASPQRLDVWLRRPPSASMLCAVGIAATVSAVLIGLSGRPHPAWPPVPPPAATARWQWSDHYVRFERWHPPAMVSAAAPMLLVDRNAAPGRAVLTCGRDLVASASTVSNGKRVVLTFDFYQLDLWQGALFALLAGAALTVTRVLARAGLFSRRRRYACPGYDPREAQQ